MAHKYKTEVEVAGIDKYSNLQYCNINYFLKSFFVQTREEKSRVIFGIWPNPIVNFIGCSIKGR